MDVAAGHTAGPQHSQRHAHPRLWLTFEGPPRPLLGRCEQRDALADANKETLSQMGNCTSSAELMATLTFRAGHQWPQFSNKTRERGYLERTRLFLEGGRNASGCPQIARLVGPASECEAPGSANFSSYFGASWRSPSKAPVNGDEANTCLQLRHFSASGFS